MVPVDPMHGLGGGFQEALRIVHSVISERGPKKWIVQSLILL